MDAHEENCIKILLSFEKVKTLLKTHNYTAIVIPIAGFGTGLAKLEIKAPKTFIFLNFELKKLVTELNEEDKIIEENKKIEEMDVC